MKRLIKWVLKAGILLLLAFALLVLGTSVFFDPNDFKQHVVDFVHEKTGHQLEINGAVELQWFPSVGLQLSGIRLITNRDSMGYPLFSTADLGLKLDLWSLLGSHVEIDELTMKQPVLNLFSVQNGQGNWESLLLIPSAKEPPPNDTRVQDSGFSLAIRRILLQDASVHWKDMQSEKRFDLEHMNVSIGYLLPGKPALIEVQLRLSEVKPAMNLDLSLNGELNTDENFSTLGIDGLEMEITAHGVDLQEAGVQLKLAADLGLNFSDESFQLNDLSVVGADTQISGQLHGKGFGDMPQLNGRLNIREINLRSWLVMLGVDVDTADSQVLTRVNAEIGLQQQDELLLLHPIHMQLDDSRIHGKAQIRIEDDLQMSGRLGIDRIDLDRYLPSADAGEGSGFQLSTRLEALRNLQLDAELTIDQLTLNNIDLQQVAMKVKSREGMILGTAGPVFSSSKAK